MGRSGGSPEIVLASAAGQDSTPPDTSLPHVLLVLDGFSATLGGGERVVLRLARLLPRWGFRVSVLTLSLDPASPALAGPPCPIYLLPLERTWDIAALRAASYLRQFLRVQKIVLVMTFFESSDLWVGSVAKTVPGMRLIWSRRDMGILRGSKHRIAYRLLRRLPDRVLAVSEEVRRHCIEVDGIAPDQVETLHNGIDLPPSLETVPPQDLDKADGVQGPRVIVSVGNVRPVKGFDVLLEAAIQVLQSFPGTVFKIAGQVLDPAYHAAMLDRARSAGVAGQFLFLGDVTDVRSLLLASDIFVLPSRSEGFSNAIVEAMACSLPVVATRAGGNAEAVLDDATGDATGRIVPPEDAEALAVALEELLAHPVRAGLLGQAGRRRAQELFTTDAMLAHLTAVFHAVLR